MNFPAPSGQPNQTDNPVRWEIQCSGTILVPTAAPALRPLPRSKSVSVSKSTRRARLSTSLHAVFSSAALIVAMILLPIVFIGHQTGDCNPPAFWTLVWGPVLLIWGLRWMSLVRVISTKASMLPIPWFAPRRAFPSITDALPGCPPRLLSHFPTSLNHG